VKNWSGIAKASGFDIPEPEMERIASVLDTLDTSFRPLVNDLRPETEPATGLHPAEDGE
jgi:hypothetical protein